MAAQQILVLLVRVQILIGLQTLYIIIKSLRTMHNINDRKSTDKDLLVNPNAKLPEILLKQPYVHEENFTSDMWNNNEEKQ